MPIVRPPGEGRKARARQRRSQKCGDLLHAPFLHGNTTKGRWKTLDMCLVDILRPRGRIAVDIGMGDNPITTLEFSKSLGDEWEVYGTECHADRLERARKQNTASSSNVKMIATDFNFELPIRSRPTIIRVLNVLRDYGLQDACISLHKLCSQLEAGGFVVEGSASPNGDAFCVLVANGDSSVEKIIFGVRDVTSPSVERIKTCLPRIWRNECLGMPWAKPLNEFLGSWTKCQATSFEMDTMWIDDGIIVWNPEDMRIPTKIEVRVKFRTDKKATTLR